MHAGRTGKSEAPPVNMHTSPPPLPQPAARKHQRRTRHGIQLQRRREHARRATVIKCVVADDREQVGVGQAPAQIAAQRRDQRVDGELADVEEGDGGLLVVLVMAWWWW